MGTLLLYAGALALTTGLVAAVALGMSMLVRTEVTGVARSLALIEHQVRPHEVAKQELPASERLVKPVLNATRSLATRLSPSGTTARLGRLLDLAGNPPSWTEERLLTAKGTALVVFGLLGVPWVEACRCAG